MVPMNYLGLHKVDGVGEAIEKAGAELYLLPPYSPALSPIETAWANFKQLLLSANARCKDALDQAISDRFNSITPDNARPGSDIHSKAYSY